MIKNIVDLSDTNEMTDRRRHSSKNQAKISRIRSSTEMHTNQKYSVQSSHFVEESNAQGFRRKGGFLGQKFRS